MRQQAILFASKKKIIIYFDHYSTKHITTCWVVLKKKSRLKNSADLAVWRLRLKEMAQVST